MSCPIILLNDEPKSVPIYVPDECYPNIGILFYYYDELGLFYNGDPPINYIDGPFYFFDGSLILFDSVPPTFYT